MRIAAYQAPLAASGSMSVLQLIRRQVEWCESHGVAILCCPEAVLGGLADYDADPTRFAIPTGRLNAVLAPLASGTVSTIVGFTEVGADGRLYNTAALFQRGAVAGLYRKLHPALNRSIYRAGNQVPVFQAQGLTLGIVICNDSNDPELARLIAGQGATMLFIPSNNAMPAARARAKLVDDTRKLDIATAAANRLWVVRADVAGRANDLVSYGTTAIVDPAGTVASSAPPSAEFLTVADLDAAL